MTAVIVRLCSVSGFLEGCNETVGSPNVGAAVLTFKLSDRTLMGWLVKTTLRPTAKKKGFYRVAKLQTEAMNYPIWREGQANLFRKG